MRVIKRMKLNNCFYEIVSTASALLRDFMASRNRAANMYARCWLKLYILKCSTGVAFTFKSEQQQWRAKKLNGIILTNF